MNPPHQHDFSTHSERDLLVHVARQLQQLTEKIERLQAMSTGTTTGLAALTQAETDLATAITANTTATTASTAATTAATAEIAALLPGLATSEDPAVATIAAALEVQVAAINANNKVIADNAASLVSSIPKPPAPPAAA